MSWLALRVSSLFLSLTALALVGATINTMTISRRWISDASNALMGFSLAERTLQVDLLDARAGLLRNYDPVNADMLAARENLEALAKLHKQPDAQVALEQLYAVLNRQNDLVEHFKSDNALLQNSLSIFWANRNTKHDHYEALTSRILSLTLNTSAQTVEEAQAALAAIPEPKPGTTDAQMVSHARLLVKILPEIDATLRRIRGLNVEEQTEKLLLRIRQDSAHRTVVIRNFQVALAVLILLSVCGFIALIIRQRWRTRELEAQAANERLTAAIALPLIETGSASFAARVQAAVERLAPHINAKKLQLNFSGVPRVAPICWPEARFNPKWLALFLQAAEEDRAWVADRVIASQHKPRVGPALDKVMRHAGVEELVLMRSAEPFRVMIGFELESGLSAERWDHAASVGSALAVIAHGARREAMQIERERLERSLARARRMETVGAMASGVAHNFNNIIGAIAGFAEMGQERTRAGSSARNSFDEIRGAADRARDLVDDILGFARQRQAAKEKLDLSEVLRGAVRLLTASSRDQDVCELQAGMGALPICGVASDLEQAILNICNNGISASGGRTLCITTRQMQLLSEREMSHAAIERGGYAVIEICDRGPGISDAAFPRLFEPFYTTKAGGTGLGLSTAWEIIQDHGGTIDVQNRAQGGACFSIWLPEMAVMLDAVIGNGAPILLIAEGPTLTAEEEVLAQLGYEPRGFALSTPVTVLLQAIKTCGVVLISSPRTEVVEALVRELTGHLEGRLLLVASSEVCTSPRINHLDYPLRPEQLLTTLMGRVESDG